MQYSQYIRWFIILAFSVILPVCILYQQDKPLNKLPTIKKQPLSTSLNTSSTSEIKLIDVTLDWHLNFSHQQRTKKVSAISDTLGSGICAFDYNNDGWTDLYFVGGSGNTRRYGKASWWHKTTGGRLFENHRGQYLKDITNDSGLNFISSGMGCAVADINADGFTDLFITGIDSNRLFKNNGDGSFSDVTSESGIVSLGWSTGANFGDFNNDGLPDLYIAKFIKFQKDATTLEINSGFHSYNSAAFKASLYDPESNQLLLNKGNFFFEDVTEKFNVANQNGRSLGARWLNINNDKWLDLVVINHPPSPNEIYINRNGQEFLLANDTFNALRGTGNHDFIAADFNNDSHNDFFLTRGSQAPIQLLQHQRVKEPYKQSRFKDMSHSFGLANTKLTPLTQWGTVSGDFNNDGYQDVFIANGKLTPDPDSQFVPLSQPNTLLINKYGKQFVIAKSHNMVLANNSSRSAITTDLNNDGQLEIIVSNNNGNIQILKPIQTRNSNKLTNNWIGFQWTNAHSLNWKTSKVQIKYGNNQQTRIISTPSSFLSQSENRIHFGLENNKQIDSITVINQEKSFTINNLTAGYYYKLDLQTEKAERVIHTKREAPLVQLAKTLDTNTIPYLVKILLTNDSPEHIRTLTLLWNQAKSEQHLNILRSFTKIKNLSELKLTQLALSDPNQKLVIMAINILKNSEVEQTMRILIEQLYVSNADIQCATTKTLSFFFREEEAMVFQKKLALKHLIRALTKSNEQGQICIAKTLGFSENKRAVIPLLKLISSNQKHSTLIKVAAINALSEIRDSKAIPALTSLIKLPDSKPNEIGAALIALARMQSKNLNNHLKDHIYSKLKSNDKNNQIKAIQLLNSIYNHPNYFFISHNLLQKNINPLIEKIVYTLSKGIDASQNKNKLTLVFINIATATGNPSLLHFLIDASKSKYNQIRKQAILGVLKISSSKKNLNKVAFNALEKQSIETLLALLNLEQVSTTIKMMIIKSISHKIHSTDLSSNKIDEIFFSLSNKTAYLLLSKLFSNDPLAHQQKLLLNICSELQISIKPLDLKNIYPEFMFTKEYFSCLYNPNADHSQSSISQIHQIRKALVILLNKNDLDIQFRHKILVNAMFHDSTITKLFLKKYSKNFTEQNMSSAFKIIKHHKLTNHYESLIWKTLKNSKYSDSLRIQAAWLANTVRPKQVNEFLQKDYNSQ